MSGFIDFEYLGKRLTDINPDLHVASRELSIPDKQKIKVAIPFTSQVFDFSSVYGSSAFSERTMTYDITCVNNERGTDKTFIHSLRTQIINWLMSTTDKQPLYDDAYPDYYLLAEVEGNSSFSQSSSYLGVLTVTFTCYAFLIGRRFEGDDWWDDFSLTDGIAQLTDFEVDGDNQWILINTNRSATYPEIKVSGEVSLSLNGVTYNLTAGVTSKIPLTSGVNNITLTGSGTLQAKWRKEAI